jgi:chemotaxis protein MotB
MGRSKKDTGNWIVTYSDLVTLLLVFFVLMYVLTPSIDQSTFDNFISFFKNSSGVMDQTSAVQQNSSAEIEDLREEINNEWAYVEDFLETHGLSAHVEIEGSNDGIKITLSDSLTFESGSSQLLPVAEMVLGRIAEMFDERIAKTEVQGHTDNVPISQNSFYRSNWHLGAARAVTVVEFLRNRSELGPENFKASSFGEFRPIATNETVTGRRQNRRVEIYVSYQELMDLRGLDDNERYTVFSTINN